MANELYGEVIWDPVIDRFLNTVPAQDLGNITGISRNEYGMTVGWVWLPEETVTEWEGKPVFNVQFGKYAFSEHDEPEPEPECERPF